MEKGSKVFIRYNELISIFHKILSLNESSFATIVSSMKPFGIRGDAFTNPKKYNLPDFKEYSFDNCINVYGIYDNRRTTKYVDMDFPFPKTEYLNKFKMFIGRNQGSGQFGETLSKPIFAKPNEACTETYLVIGLFDNEEQMLNCYSYMKTKFFRAILGMKKNDQGAAQGVYEFIPMQDFSKPWTDEELYTKYGLSEEEIAFIEENVQPMES